MNCNCDGCLYEFWEALQQQKEGNHQATCDDMPWTFPDGEKHFFLYIVDDDGNWIMG